MAFRRQTDRSFREPAARRVIDQSRKQWSGDMRDSTIKKVSEKTAPKGAMGQTYLVSGKHLAMRLWRNEAPQADEPPSRRDYETVGYVIAGRAELNLEVQTIHLAPGDSWLVPAHAETRYRSI